MHPGGGASGDAWERGVAQGETNAMIKVINNLWRSGKSMETIKSATGWINVIKLSKIPGFFNSRGTSTAVLFSTVIPVLLCEDEYEKI